MDRKILEVFEQQEREDQYKMTKGLEDAIYEELDNGKHIVGQIQRNGLHKLSDVLDFSIAETLVRISAEFTMRKHTACQVPYYHSHDFYEMVYVWQGSCCQKITGDAGELVLLKGDLCLLTPGAVHAMLPCTKSDLIVKTVIPNPMMKQLLTHMEEGSGAGGEGNLPELLKSKNKISIYRSLPENGSQIKWLMDRLLHEVYWRTDFRDTAIESLLVLLLVTLGRHGFEKADEGILQIVSSYIRSHIQDANMEGLAREIGYSSRQLRRKIAEASGGTFSDVLWKIRMEEAAALLNETDIAVEDISKLIGYNSTSGFYKRFFRVFHMTPSKYRKIYDNCTRPAADKF